MTIHLRLDHFDGSGRDDARELFDVVDGRLERAVRIALGAATGAGAVVVIDLDVSAWAGVERS